MVGEPDPMTTLRWLQRAPGFSTLMLGRIELAQISGAAGSENWFYTLRFCIPDERSGYSAPTEAEAKAVAEDHARKVLADAE